MSKLFKIFALKRLFDMVRGRRGGTRTNRARY